MRHRCLASVGPLAVLIVVASLATVLVAGQTAPAAGKAKTAGAAKNWTPSRTVWGDPDLQGIWNNSTTTPLERPSELAGKQVLTSEEVAQRDEREALNADRPRNGDPGTYNALWFDRGKSLTRTSLIVDPPDGRIPPLTPEAQKRAAAGAEDRRKRGPDPADSWEDRNLAERCITRGAPKLPGGYNNNFHILQSPGYVTILQEMIHEVRIIPLDGRPHVHHSIRQWMGDSRGRWDGDTLVVDTTNFNDKIINNTYNCCGAAGANLHVVERFRRVDADTIEFQYTVDDPTTWARPWTVAVPMTKTQVPIYEYACHEGNYGMIGILSGARAQEKTAEAAAKKGSK
jgi:hypothetical protein